MSTARKEGASREADVRAIAAQKESLTANAVKALEQEKAMMEARVKQLGIELEAARAKHAQVGAV